uniref:hypothetical protein n=1 Tax=Burkholderia diffusa TaxID=488732 RepID=UPI001CC3EF58|nr:hypothetical protein [Burkholderia diffusa]
MAGKLPAENFVVKLSILFGCMALLFLAVTSSAYDPKVISPIVHVANVGACEFKLTDTFGGELRANPSGSPPYADYNVELRRKTLPNAFHIQFGCDTRPPVQVCHEFGGVEHTAHGWVAWDTLDQGPPPKAAHVEVRELRSVNGSGAVRIESDTTGDEQNRGRNLGFCLTSLNGATLFGGTSVDALYGKHKSVEPEVMQLLRSIEFIDTSGDGARGASATVPSATVRPHQ